MNTDSSSTTAGKAGTEGARVPPPRSTVRRLALRGFRAACEALYPENDFGAPSWRDTDMVERASRLWDALPPSARLMMEALYAGLELGAGALLPAIGPLSSLSVENRLRLFLRWKTSRVWPLRFVAEAVKTSSTMVYMAHPAVHRYIGAPGAGAECLVPAEALLRSRAGPGRTHAQEAS